MADYNAIVGAATEHPLLSVVCYDELERMQDSVNRFEVYGLFLRDDRLSDLVYGTSRYDYDYDAGTLISVAPRQVGGAEKCGQGSDIRGWALLFAPDLLRGTHLEGQMQQFHFFSYSSNEVLLMTSQERQTIVGCLRQMRTELHSSGRHRSPGSRSFRTRGLTLCEPVNMWMHEPL